MLAYFYIDPYFWVTIPGALVALWAQMRLSSAYAVNSRVAGARGVTGAETARTLLDRNGMANHEVFRVEGELTDHYDPSKRAVFLSESVYDGTSLAAMGVAAHEVGHAIQHKAAYGPLGLRMALVGVTGFASQASWWIIIAGALLGGFGSRNGFGHTLVILGVMLFSVVVFFQVITLPVEYDASSRAKRELVRLGLVNPTELAGVEQVLGAAALTYVASMLNAVLQLLQLLLRLRGSGRRGNDW